MQKENSLNHFLQKCSDWIASHKYWITAAILIVALRILAPTVFWIMVIAFFLYILVNPAVDYLQTKTKSRRIAALITIILLTGFLVFSLSVIIPTLVNQISDLIKNYQIITVQVQEISNYLQEKAQKFQELLPGNTQLSIKDGINQSLLFFSNNLLGFFTAIGNSLTRVITSILQFFIAYILFIYMLFDTKPIEKIKAFLLHETTAKEKKIIALSYEQITAYFGGQILMCVLSFFAVWIFYSIIGLRFPLLLALWNGLVQFIPFFGAIIAMVPALLVTIPDQMNLILPILIFFGIQGSILAYIIAPHILGKSMRLSPLVVFLMIMIGAEVAGIWGMIFVLPLTSLVILYIKTRKS